MNLRRFDLKLVGSAVITYMYVCMYSYMYKRIKCMSKSGLFDFYIKEESALPFGSKHKNMIFVFCTLDFNFSWLNLIYGIVTFRGAIFVFCRSIIASDFWKFCEV